MVRPDDPYHVRSGPLGAAGPPLAWGGPPASGWPPQRPARSPWWIVAVVALVTVPVTLLLILLLMPDRGSGQGSSSPRDSTVPPALVGAWTGAVTAAAYPGIPVAAQVTLVEGGVGEVVGSVSGTAPGAACSAPLTLVSADASLLRFESGTPNGPGCPAVVSSLELTVRSDGSLVYEESSALGTATGVLRRVG